LDERQFDELTKVFARRTSRRGALRALVGAGTAGAVTLLGTRSASARQCRDLGQACRSNADCCSRFCPSDSYVCSCPGGFEACQGTCLPTCPGQLVRNPSTCECACPPGTTACANDTCCIDGQQICFQGSCRPACPQGTFPCGSAACCQQGQACNGFSCGFFCSNGTFCPSPPFRTCFCFFGSCSCVT
jgi:hypothetical protein